jgi:hypothetical protein
VATGSHERHAGIALVLAAAAVLAASLGARAALLFGYADDGLEHAARTEVKRAAALVEDIRFVYADEAPQIFRYLKAKVSGAELKKAAPSLPGIARDETLVDAETQLQLAHAFRGAVGSNPRYLMPGGGFDLGKRLADVRAQAPDLVALDPERLQRDAERISWHASLDATTTLAAGVAFLLGALSQAFGALRRPLLPVAVLLVVAGTAAGIAFEYVLP